MFEGLKSLEDWWIGPLLLFAWIVVGVLFYALQQIRRRRKEEADAASDPEDRMETTLEAHRRAEEEERGERDQP